MTTTHFLTRIDASPAAGWISLSPCPGRQDHKRNLSADLAAIRASGIASVVTLCEHAELEDMGVEHLGREVIAAGMDWQHLPIIDFGTPGSTWESFWAVSGPMLRAHLREGRGVHVHCRGGLGRSGMIVARMLVELGVPAEAAITRVRAFRPGAIETAEQEAAVRAATVQP